MLIAAACDWLYWLYCAADCFPSEASLVVYSAPYGHNTAQGLMSCYIKGLFSYLPVLTSVIICSFHITGGEEMNPGWLWWILSHRYLCLLEVKKYHSGPYIMLYSKAKNKQDNCICFKRIVWHFMKHGCLFIFLLGVRRSIPHSWVSPWSYTQQLQGKHQSGSVQR